MPLKSGKTPAIISKNISEMVRAGHSKKQSIAAALSKAKDSESKTPFKKKK